MSLSRLSAAALLTAMCVSSLAAAPATPRPSGPYLRGGQCLEPASARGFTALDDRRVLVDGGRNRYLIEVSQSCWNLDFANALGFRGDPVTGKVCGGVMDAILLRGEAPCRIQRMQVLDKEQYQAALRERDEWQRARRAQREAAKKR